MGGDSQTSELAAWQEIESIGFGSGLDLYKSRMAFWGDTFDWVNNRWTDKSGNGNHATLKGASARTSASGNLDYTITGLLTSDTVEVVTGSDTPTIPSNGTLRIAEGQTVYGVTIKRAGEVWAVIPFCEPMAWENVPTVSYDVSGNAHHATCSTLAEGNITTQSNYFYLMRYGFSIGGAELSTWNLSSWTGSIDTLNAIFSGVTLGDTQQTYRNIQPTPDGTGCRIYREATYNMRLRKTSALTVGKRYRLRLRLANYTTTGRCGIACSNLGFTVANFKWFVGNNTFDVNGVATATSFELGCADTTPGSTIDLYDVKLQLMQITPALMSGVSDAIGNSIEYVQDGKTFLRYAGALQMPEGIVTADQKGYWSDYMNQGLCVSGKTYLIEKTETNHFGLGKVQFDEFVSNGTEVLDDNNEVRELYLHDAQRGFFFDDDTTPHPRTWDDFVQLKTHYLYCNQAATDHSYWFNHTDIGIYPSKLYNSALYGWKEQKFANTLTELVLLKSTVFFSDADKISFNALFNFHEDLDFGHVAMTIDSWVQADYESVVDAHEDYHFKVSRAIYFNDDVTKEQTDAVLAAGHEIFPHTPTFGGSRLSTYKDFGDTSANYSEAELIAYYAEVKAYMESNGYNAEDKILPGGQTSVLTQSMCQQHMKALYHASGSENVNRIPIVNYAAIGRHKNSYVDATETNTAKTQIDTAIIYKGWCVLYNHTYEFGANSITNMRSVLEYIQTKIAAGERIRYCKLSDTRNHIKKIR